jgi:3-deoxy-D-manno-octulosonic-acid transferase
MNTLSEATPQKSESTPKKVSQGMRCYRVFFRTVFSLFGRFIFGANRWEETCKLPQIFAQMPDKRTEERRVWFHAASVGELESLWPLVERASREKEIRLLITVFSESAWNHLHKMARKLEGAPPLYVGYSPVEGGWRRALDSANPDLFVTAKYEAWPEIWDSLGVREVPLAIIGAKPRSSILWAKRILGFLGGCIPKIIFFSFDPENEVGLAERFPGSHIQHGSDPRWDRVFQRSRLPQSRVDDLRKEFEDLPRPWGALGSAWAPDIGVLPDDAATSVKGTLWVVPHRTEPRSVSEIEILLRERGYTPMRTGGPDRIRPAGKIAVIVDEMGFLAELYALMDWAFIGGGFSSSIHSTIEPAIYGLPIYGGPGGQMKFDEIPLLKKQSQLRLFGDQGHRNRQQATGDFLNWLNHEFEGTPEAQRDRRDEWKNANLRHRGASERIWARLYSFLQTP